MLMWPPRGLPRGPWEIERMERWVRVAAADEVVSGRGRVVSAEGRRLALFNDSGEFYAVDDACPHQGASLAEGALLDGRVICPLHAWVFDLASGRCPRDTHEAVRAYPTRCVEDAVEVNMEPTRRASDDAAHESGRDLQ